MPQTFDYEFTHLEEKMNTEHLNDLMSRFETHYAEEVAFDQVKS